MNTEFAVVDDRGQLLVPAEMLKAIGIEPGDRVAVYPQGGRVIVRRASNADVRRVIVELRGITSGGPSMANELIAERRKEDQEAGW